MDVMDKIKQSAEFNGKYTLRWEYKMSSTILQIFSQYLIAYWLRLSTALVRALEAKY